MLILFVCQYCVRLWNTTFHLSEWWQKSLKAPACNCSAEGYGFESRWRHIFSEPGRMSGELMSVALPSASVAWTKTLTLAITFKPEVIEISYVYFLWQDLSHGTIIFDLVTLTLKFDLLLKNFNLGYNFKTRSDRAFILHMCVPCDKTFHMVPQFLTSWPWPWSLTYFWKTLTLAITFKPEEMGLSYCTCVFLVTRPFTCYHNFWPRDPDLEVWPTCEKR